MNPLTVLTGSMIMQRRALMAGGDGHVWLDAERRYRLSLDASDQALGLQLDGAAHALSPVREDSDLDQLPPGLAVAPSSMSLQSLIQLRQITGHPVLLADEGRILGVCCQAEIIRALAGGRHTSANGP